MSVLTKKNWISLSALFLKLLSVFAKVAKSLKFILAAGSFGIYTLLFSWKFALLIMFGIGIHELGHVWAMRRVGMKTKGFYFIPLFGGAAVPDEEFRSGNEEIFIALMGPTFGILTILPGVVLYALTGHPAWAAAASWLGFVNLFNLFPVNPLDGGRVIKGLAFALNYNIGLLTLALGFTAALAVSWIFGLYFLVFITILGMLEIRPFAKWFILFPVSIIILIVAFPIIWTSWGLIEAKDFVRSWYQVFFLENRKDENDKPPVMDVKFSEDSTHWVLTKNQLGLYLLWYCGMILLFIGIMLGYGHIPGADIAEQFLRS